MPDIPDGFSRECLTVRVRRKPDPADVIDALTDLSILRGMPAFIRSDNGPPAIGPGPMARFIALAVRQEP